MALLGRPQGPTHRVAMERAGQRGRVVETAGIAGGFFDALNKDVNVLNEALHAAGHEIPAIALFSGSGGTRPDPASVQQYEQSLFDPKNWTDSQAFVQNLVATGIWQAQSQTLTALLQPTSLTADSYFFLLHLLIALCTSTAADQQLAQKVVSASTTSPEYPNDTFINQVVLPGADVPDRPYGQLRLDQQRAPGRDRSS